MQLFFGAKCKKSILFFAAELPNHGIGFTVRAFGSHGIFTDLQAYILKQKHIFLSIILCCFRFYRIAVHGKRNRVRIGIHFYDDVLPFAYREAARGYVGYGVFAPIGLVKQIPHKTAYSRRNVCRPSCPSKLFQVCGRVTGTKSAVSSVFASKQNSQSVRNVCVVRIVFSLFLLDALIVS